MLEAQEMFKNSNKVTRPEKALILGFMAGSRGKWRLFHKSFILLSGINFGYTVLNLSDIFQRDRNTI